MQRRRVVVHRHRYASDEEEDEEDEEEEEEEAEEETSSSVSGGSESPRRRRTRMRCVSCQERYECVRAGTCKECYDEANDKEEDLKRQIDDLNLKLSFLRLNNLSFSDLVLVASSSSDCNPIPAHKLVLASRSPVLRAMLESEMEEGRSGTIKVEDATHGALKAFVSYMYTAEIEAMDDQIAWELLVLAEKYEVGHLKSHCEAFLVSNLSWDNSVPTYALAHRHNAPLLLEAALSHITDNMGKLSLSDHYLHLKATDPRLVVDIYEAYLSKQVDTAAPAPAPSPSTATTVVKT